MPQPSAAILAIGDELLSGRTRDANVAVLARWLTERGVALKEARIAPDDERAIVSALNALRDGYDYVFTSGGIGPTHDDITADAVATAFGVELIEHPKAAAMIEAWYEARGEDITPARRRMARMPANADLIVNPVTGAPGIKVENVFVMAGVPRIFQGMLAAVEPYIRGGARIHACAVTASGLAESRIADDLYRIEIAHPGVSVGSYPIDGDEKGVTVIARSESSDAALAAVSDAAEAMRALGAAPQFRDRKDDDLC